MEQHCLKILLIEDDEDDYILTRDLLSEAEGGDFDLEWIATYDTALEAIARNQHDAYLVDYRLGERDGVDLLREAVEQGCHGPIILLTGKGGYEVDVEAMKAGAADYLVKGQINAALLERSIRYAIEHKQMEEELRRYNLELQEALKTKDEMIANVWHELRTPLTHISGYSQLLVADLTAEQKLNSEQSKHFQIIEGQTQALTHLVDMLLTLQTLAPEHLNGEVVDLRCLVIDMGARWQEQSQKAQIPLDLQVTVGLLPVWGDYGWLLEALDQLLDNAFKFTSKGSTASIQLEKRGDEAHLSVSDTGTGIPPDKLERVFERFYQVDGSSTRDHGGMGIGLALVQKIVTLHDGRVWTESDGIAGHGTTFHIVLPVASTPEGCFVARPLPARGRE